MNGVGSAAVIGLGLIGGSIARELAAHGLRVRGYDRDPDTLRAALDEGTLERALDHDLRGVDGAGLVILAVPVSAAAVTLEHILPHLDADCVVTDVGSTKRSIVEAAVRLGVGDRFVGSHPLAGDHRSGWDVSRTGLFRDARVFLCPTPHTIPAALNRVRGMWQSFGALQEMLDPAAHDQHVAWISHLPQAVSTALALALASAGIPRSGLGPGGRDTTRLAGSSPELWSAVCLDNADALAGALEALEDHLRSLRSALSRADGEQVRQRLSAAREWFET